MLSFVLPLFTEDIMMGSPYYYKCIWAISNGLTFLIYQNISKFFLTHTLFCLLLAQQRPRITEHPTDAVAAKEEPLTLNCKATGRPPPDIIWFHNGVPLVPDERKVILPEGSLFFLRYVSKRV